MNYLLSYPKLSAQLKELTVNHNFCDEQFLMFVNMGLDNEPMLANEIITSFNDEVFSWMEILNNEEIGEVFDCDSEDEAREFAITMFLDPATNNQSTT